MKLASLRRLLPPAILLLASASRLPAVDTVASVPEGFINFTIPAGSQATPSVATFSIPLSAAIPANFAGRAAGTISSVTATTLTNTAAGWTAGALSQAASPYFLRIKGGAAAGRTLLISTAAGQQNTATTVTVDNQGTPLTGLGIVAGDTYEIFPADTLFSLFGSDVLGGSSTANADVVRLLGASGWQEYYYDTTAAQWRINSVATSQNNVVIRPDTGVIFYRRGSAPLALSVSGRVPATDLRIVLNEAGTSFITGFPVDTPLAQAGYDSMPGWVSNNGSIPDADKVIIFDGAFWNSYNYNQSAAQWRNGSVPVNQGAAIKILAGNPVIIESPTGAAGVKVWTCPLPYSL